MPENELFRMNVHTKGIHTPVDDDYCIDSRILPAVRDLYKAYNRNTLLCYHSIVTAAPANPQSCG